MTLKERLAKVDPAKLEAGAELDALVAECLGWEYKSIESSSETLEDAYWEVPEGYPGRDMFGTEDFPPTFSTSPGLAFEVLWPRLKKELGAGHNHGILSVEAETDALVLCRAVVSVAKARSR